MHDPNARPPSFRPSAPPFFDDEPTIADPEEDLAARMREALGDDDAPPTSIPPDHVSWRLLPEESPGRRTEIAGGSPPIPPEINPHALEVADRSPPVRYRLMGLPIGWSPGGAAGIEGAPPFDINDEPTLEAVPESERYTGSVDALARVEVLRDGSVIASGSSLEHAAVLVEPFIDGRPSAFEHALLPLFRGLLTKLGPGRMLALVGQADHLNEVAAGEKAPVLRRCAVPR